MDLVLPALVDVLVLLVVLAAVMVVGEIVVVVVAGVVVCLTERGWGAQMGTHFTLQHEGERRGSRQQPSSFTTLPLLQREHTVKCSKLQATLYNTSQRDPDLQTKNKTQTLTQTRRGRTDGEARGIQTQQQSGQRE